MGATLDIKLFHNGGSSLNSTRFFTILPVVTVTTTGVTHCNNSSLTVTYSGAHFSGSNNTTVTVGQNTTAQIYANYKSSGKYTSNFSGTVTVTVTLATSSGTIKKSKSASYTSFYDSSNFNPKPSLSWTVTDKTASNSVYLGSSVVINSLNNSGYGYKVRFAFSVTGGGTHYSEPVQEPGTVFTFSTDTYAPIYFVDTTSVYMNYRCEWVNVDGSYIMSDSIYNGYLLLPSSVRPTITSVTPSDTQSYRNTYGVYIGTKSILQASVEASGIYGSTITKVEHQIDNLSVSTTDPTITKLIGRLDQSGSRILTTTVTDSRGRTAVRNTAITVVAYTNPTLNFQVNRWNLAENSEDDSSTTTRLVALGVIPSLNGIAVNGQIVFQWRAKGSGTWTTAGTFDVTGPEFTKQIDVEAQSLDNQYEYQATLTDSFGISVLASGSVGFATPVLEFHGSGKGVGIGIVAPETGFDIGMQANFRGVQEDGYSRIQITDPEGNDSVILANLSGDQLQLLTNALGDYDRAFVNSHIFMKNNAAIGGLTTAGVQTTMLRLNSLNQVELNWTMGGLRGRVMKLLWSGNLTAGGVISIPEERYYNIFALCCGDGGLALAARYPNTGGYISAASFMAQDFNMYMATMYANNVGQMQLTNVRVVNVTTGQYIDTDVRRVYGVL